MIQTSSQLRSEPSAILVTVSSRASQRVSIARLPVLLTLSRRRGSSVHSRGLVGPSTACYFRGPTENKGRPSEFRWSRPPRGLRLLPAFSALVRRCREMKENANQKVKTASLTKTHTFHLIPASRVSLLQLGTSTLPSGSRTTPQASSAETRRFSRTLCARPQRRLSLSTPSPSAPATWNRSTKSVRLRSRRPERSLFLGSRLKTGLASPKFRVSKALLRKVQRFRPREDRSYLRFLKSRKCHNYSLWRESRVSPVSRPKFLHQ